MRLIFFPLIIIVLFSFNGYAKEVSFTQEDRERLIKIETTLNVFMKQVDKRFELMQSYMDKRFEVIDKRFEDINKRFEDINKRFEDINKRFDDINKRFEQLYTFLWILTGIFTTLTLGVIGFAYWDRRTIIRKAKEETIEQLEREGKLRNLIEALRELAKEDQKLANLLKKYNLL